MKTNKQLAIEVNKNLKSKRATNSMYAIFDGEKQVSTYFSYPQLAWSEAATAICCPYPVGALVRNKRTGAVYTVIGSEFGYPHHYMDENGKLQGDVFWLFRTTDSHHYELVDGKENG